MTITPLIAFRRTRPNDITLGLVRIKAALAELPTLPNDTKIITIAGTNGKGSVGKILATLLTHSKQSTLWFNSPHIRSYATRFQLDNQTASEATMMDAFLACRELAYKAKLTVFEFDFILAYTLILQQRPRYAMLEVGMGGRLDAVNALDTDCAIITSIGLDHWEFLGDSLDRIAYEKAAIMRAHAPAIIGQLTTDVVSQTARTIGADTVIAGVDFTTNSDQISWHYYSHHPRLAHKTHIPLPQLLIANWSLALTAHQILGHTISDTALHPLAQQTQLEGRLSLIAQMPYVICDVAANAPAIDVLAHHVDTFCKQRAVKRVYALTGFLKNKATSGMLTPLLPIVDEWHVIDVVCDEFPSRSSTAADTREMLGIDAYTYTNVRHCAQRLTTTLQTNDLLLCFGSFYLLPDCYDNFSKT